MNIRKFTKLISVQGVITSSKTWSCSMNMSVISTWTWTWELWKRSPMSKILLIPKTHTFLPVPPLPPQPLPKNKIGGDKYIANNILFKFAN